MNVAAIDTETYYDKVCSVKTLGNEAYTRHPDFEVLCVSGYTTDLGGEPWAQPVETTPWDEIHGLPRVAHNAAFDWAVLDSIPSAPKVDPDKWYDSAALCAYHQYPRDLAGAAKEILGESVSKTVRTGMSGKRMEDLDEEAKREFFEYAKRDAKLCHDIFQKLYPVTPSHEIRLSQIAMQQGRKGVCIDVEKLESGLTALHEANEVAVSKLPWVQDGYKIQSRNGLFKACAQAEIPPPPGTSVKDPLVDAWLEEHADCEPWVRGLQNHRSINRIIKTLEGMKRRIDGENIMSYGIKYCGADATGRFSGDQGINMLNLNKGAVHGVKLRHLIKARPGHKFVVADLANIEPRCLAWLTKDEVMLDSLRAGNDLYEAHARSTMHYTDPRPLKEVDNALRDMAKVRVLSMGYGLGAERHAKNPMRPIPLDQAESEINEFRKTSKASGYWDYLHLQFNRAARSDGELELPLPSGRTQFYTNIRYDHWKTKDGIQKKGWRCNTIRGGRLRFPFWGSKLCENVCQGVARDVFCHGLLKVWEAGIHVPWTTYDELVAEVPEADAEEAAEEIRKAMTTTPDWIPGLPLAVDLHIADYYDKE